MVRVKKTITSKPGFIFTSFDEDKESFLIPDEVWNEYAHIIAQFREKEDQIGRYRLLAKSGKDIQS